MNIDEVIQLFRFNNKHVADYGDIITPYASKIDDLIVT